MKNKPSILWIQPYDRPWYDPGEWLVKNRNKAAIPRSLMEICSLISQEYECHFLDLNLEIKRGETLQKSVTLGLNIYKPDVILLSMPTFVHGKQIKEIIDVIRQELPNCKIILGGSAISLIKDLPCKWWGINVCYNGFGSEINELIYDVLQGTYYKHFVSGKNEIISFNPQKLYTLNERISFDNFLKRYQEVSLSPIGIIEMSRGCMFQCSYCALNQSNYGFHIRSTESVLAEIDYLLTHGVRDFHLIDPTFGIDHNTAENFLNQLALRKETYSEMRIEMLTRPEYINQTFAKKLFQAGVWRCGIGMETMDDDMLKSVAKTLQPKKVHNAVNILSNAGIQIKLFHILFPSNLSISTIEFLLELCDRNIDFVIQSSFMRNLTHSLSSTDFLSHDHTVFGTEDTEEQLQEMLLTNIAFPSMDVALQPDIVLRQDIKKKLTEGKSLKEFFTKEGNMIAINCSDGSYHLEPQNDRSIFSCFHN